MQDSAIAEPRTGMPVQGLETANAALAAGEVFDRYMRLDSESLTAAAIPRARQETDFLLYNYRGQDVEIMPIHPLMAESLGLTGYDPDQMHRWHRHGWTFRGYLLKYIRWEPYLR